MGLGDGTAGNGGEQKAIGVGENAVDDLVGVGGKVEGRELGGMKIDWGGMWREKGGAQQIKRRERHL